MRVVGRPVAAPTTRPAKTATPPRYGTGAVCSLSDPGRSTMPVRLATVMTSGVRIRVVAAAITAITVRLTPAGSGPTA